MWNPSRRGHDALATVLAQNAIRAPDLVPFATAAWRPRPGTTTVVRRR